MADDQRGRMQVGIQLPEVEWEVSFPELLDMARTAEAVGFDSLWLGDHLLYELEVGDRGPWEVWTSLAAIAASTTTIQLGPLVASTSFHAPAMLAKLATTVDAISQGRLILGLGAGWNRREYDAFGFPYDRRVSRFGEAFTIIRTLLRDGEIDFHGDFYDVDRCVLSPRSSTSGPPIVVGSIGDRMLDITLPHVDAWNMWWSQYGNSVEGFARREGTRRSLDRCRRSSAGRRRGHRSGARAARRWGGSTDGRLRRLRYRHTADGIGARARRPASSVRVGRGRSRATGRRPDHTGIHRVARRRPRRLSPLKLAELLVTLAPWVPAARVLR
jgi:alkanesulfonate monooxygenase SsuD/methylene tetrahydromethanopterin reductase-like flavin-dependent oxidoreductase (luciferase family)